MRAATKRPPSSSCSSRDKADFSCSDTPCKCVESAVSSLVRASTCRSSSNLLIAQGGRQARAAAHVAVNQPDRDHHQTNIQNRARRRHPARQAKILVPFGIGRRGLGRLFAAHVSDNGDDRVHGALADIRADNAGRREMPRFLSNATPSSSSPSSFPGQDSQLVKFAAAVIAAIGVMQPVERLADFATASA